MFKINAPVRLHVSFRNFMYTKGAMNLARSLVFVSAATFLFIGTFGIGSAGMTTNSRGQMSGCLFTGSPTICHMSPLEHAFEVQNMFTAIPLMDIFLPLLSILLSFSFVLLAPLIWRSVSFLFKPILRFSRGRYKYIPRHTLQEALSLGILNSKAY